MQITSENVGRVLKRRGQPYKLTPWSIRFIRRLFDEEPKKSVANVGNVFKEDVCAVNISTTEIKYKLYKLNNHDLHSRLLISRHKEARLKRRIT